MFQGVTFNIMILDLKRACALFGRSYSSKLCF
jgi:hypothetical protein